MSLVWLRRSKTEDTSYFGKLFSPLLTLPCLMVCTSFATASGVTANHRTTEPGGETRSSSCSSLSLISCTEGAERLQVDAPKLMRRVGTAGNKDCKGRYVTGIGRDDKDGQGRFAYRSLSLLPTGLSNRAVVWPSLLSCPYFFPGGCTKGVRTEPPKRATTCCGRLMSAST